MVHAGAGGVGLLLTQWATSIGARVITTALDAGEGRTVAAGRSDRGSGLPRRPGRVRPAGAGADRRARGAAAYDGVGRTTFDASLASLAIRGTLALFGASSGPVPPVDPQRLNTAGSVYLTRPNLGHFIRTPDEFAWRAGELLDAIADGSVTVTVGGHYPLAEAQRAHEDLQAAGRRVPWFCCPETPARRPASPGASRRNDPKPGVSRTFCVCSRQKRALEQGRQRDDRVDGQRDEHRGQVVVRLQEQPQRLDRVATQHPGMEPVRQGEEPGTGQCRHRGIEPARGRDQGQVAATVSQV